ncbi:AAA family ATPase [Candidatus Saccharibacteria bacterium]|nr:AAA family ATPase [Candidatus Saccharibacteria bacterium]
MMAGDSVFLTGAPGSGKTYVLNQFIKYAKQAKKRIAITASTGIAATHIGGTTVHSWSGLGIREEITDRDEKWLKENDRLLKRYNNIDILIIDEVSMIHGKRLDMINSVCKLLRDSDQPFGGLQVVLTGDLFQLPPINRGDESIDFAHLSETWQELNPKICYLNEQHRQANDSLLDLLEAMRANDINQAHYDALGERLGLESPEDVAITKLYSHNADVEQINDSHLKALDEEVKVFVMETHGVQSKVEQLIKSVLAPEILELKVGAEVMFVANNFAEGYVNGTRGRVVDFRDGFPYVELQRNRRVIKVATNSWALEEDGKERARVTQLPLRLAWAITIHKSQGMSLDSAEIDLSRAFTPGMGYVALSRVRTLDGVYLKGINNTALAMHSEIFDFDTTLKQSSQNLATSISDDDYIFTSEAPEGPKLNNKLNETLLEVLKTWRMQEAATRRVPLYMIASNKTIETLATDTPTSESKLKLVTGIGPKMIERYGGELLDIIREHLGVMEIPDERDEKLKLFLQQRGIVLSEADIKTLKSVINGE